MIALSTCCLVQGETMWVLLHHFTPNSEMARGSWQHRQRITKAMAAALQCTPQQSTQCIQHNAIQINSVCAMCGAALLNSRSQQVLLCKWPCFSTKLSKLRLCANKQVCETWYISSLRLSLSLSPWGISEGDHLPSALPMHHCYLSTVGFRWFR